MLVPAFSALPLGSGLVPGLGASGSCVAFALAQGGGSPASSLESRLTLARLGVAAKLVAGAPQTMPLH